MKKKYEQGMHALEKQVGDLRSEIADLQGQAAVLREAQHRASCRHEEEKRQLQVVFEEEKTQLREELRLEHEQELRARLQQAEESFRQEREGLAQAAAWTEDKARGLTRDLEQSFQEQLLSLVEKHAVEKEELRKELSEHHQRELQEGR